MCMMQICMTDSAANDQLGQRTIFSRRGAHRHAARRGGATRCRSGDGRPTDRRARRNAFDDAVSAHPRLVRADACRRSLARGGRDDGAGRLVDRTANRRTRRSTGRHDSRRHDGFARQTLRGAGHRQGTAGASGYRDHLRDVRADRQSDAARSGRGDPHAAARCARPDRAQARATGGRVFTRRANTLPHAASRAKARRSMGTIW